MKRFFVPCLSIGAALTITGVAAGAASAAFAPLEPYPVEQHVPRAAATKR